MDRRKREKKKPSQEYMVRGQKYSMRTFSKHSFEEYL